MYEGKLEFLSSGAICMLLSKRGIKYKFLSPSEWRRHLLLVLGVADLQKQ